MATEQPTGTEKANPHDGQEPSWLRRMLRKTWVKVMLGLGAVLIIGGGVLWYMNARQYESTTDAFIDAHIINVAPQVAGRVWRVAVQNNQKVHNGELLALLDPTPYDAKLQEAQAQLSQAITQRAQALADVKSAAAEAEKARRDLGRYRALERASPAAIAQQTVDQAVAAKRAAVAKLQAAREQVNGAEAQIEVARAARNAARLNVGYTQILAPEGGHIAQRSVAGGDYVSPGEAMMSIVPSHLWVTANFKETQLDDMRPGQKATVSIDACGGATVKAHVVSIQRGAGQAFQILPPQNAAGNFVKVVQRVPVRIALDTAPKHCTLGPGMSVEPSVKVR